MILLDSDVLLIDLRYQHDPKAAENRQALDRIRQDGLTVAVTTQVLLEVVGVMSYQTAPADVLLLPSSITAQYGLTVLPDPATHPDYSGCTVAEVIDRIARRMALGDAVLAVQVEKFAPRADALLTWNAKHFRGKVTVPVLTPREWLTQHPPAGPTP